MDRIFGLYPIENLQASSELEPVVNLGLLSKATIIIT
jgi:hypothetical protein